MRCDWLSGAGNGIRTRDPQLGKLLLYQLSYARPGQASDGGFATRTSDPCTTVRNCPGGGR